MPLRPSVVAVLVLAVFAAPAASAAVFRVDVDSGSDLGGCGSAVSPCASIQRAVNLAQSGDEIRVAEGIYTYQPALDPCSVGDTGVACIVNKRITLLGGFDGGDWTNPAPQDNPTIIDGQISRRGVLVTRTFPGAPAASLVIDGFTLRNGRAVGGLGGPDGNNGRGGGLKAALSDLTVRDCVFLDNRAVGANTGSGPGGGGAGGGLFSATTPELRSVVQLERVVFSGNQAIGGTGPERGGLAVGGGMFVNFADLTATDVELEANFGVAGTSSGSGIAGGLRADALGGGLAMLSEVTANVVRLTAAGNRVSGGTATTGVGGGAFGGGVYVETSKLTMSDSRMSDNQAIGGNGALRGGIGAGGGLMTFDGGLDLHRSWLLANRAEGGDSPMRKGEAGGGGAYLERVNDPAVTVALTNCVIADNFVQLGQGGGNVGGGGGGLFLLGNDALLRHLTIARNGLSETPLVGQAVVVVNRNVAVSEADIQHTIVSDHQSLEGVAAIQVQPDAVANLARPMFADNALNTNQASPVAGTITGLATALHAADAGYVSPGPPDFDYHLLLSSSAVDEAPGSQVGVDIDGAMREDPHDIGADEACAAVESLLLADTTLTGTAVHEACAVIRVRDYTVAASGDLTVRAGARVIFENDFRVLGDGRLSVFNALP